MKKIKWRIFYFLFICIFRHLTFLSRRKICFRFLSQRETSYYEKDVVSEVTVGEMSRFVEHTKPISYLNKDEHALEKLIFAMMSTDFLITHIIISHLITLYRILHFDI